MLSADVRHMRAPPAHAVRAPQLAVHVERRDQPGEAFDRAAQQRRPVVRRTSSNIMKHSE